MCSCGRGDKKGLDSFTSSLSHKVYHYGIFLLRLRNALQCIDSVFLSLDFFFLGIVCVGHTVLDVSSAANSACKAHSLLQHHPWVQGLQASWTQVLAGARHL